jgi:hypothetical protein
VRRLLLSPGTGPPPAPPPKERTARQCLGSLGIGNAGVDAPPAACSAAGYTAENYGWGQRRSRSCSPRRCRHRNEKALACTPWASGARRLGSRAQFFELERIARKYLRGQEEALVPRLEARRRLRLQCTSVQIVRRFSACFNGCSTVRNTH